MKTIFDYNPTPEELNELGFDSFLTWAELGIVGGTTKDVYLEKVPQNKAIFDIAILLELRNSDASEFWNQIPELHQEYVLGFDYEVIEA